jgi:hypothetical protein
MHLWKSGATIAEKRGEVTAKGEGGEENAKAVLPPMKNQMDTDENEELDLD